VNQVTYPAAATASAYVVYNPDTQIRITSPSHTPSLFN
jgi:hypothetical protein